MLQLNIKTPSHELGMQLFFTSLPFAFEAR
jgi:hypothetical protein